MRKQGEMKSLSPVRTGVIPQIEGTIHVVGPCTLQNQIMSAWLEQETGATCLLEKDLGDISFPDVAMRNGQPTLVLLDCHEKDSNTVIEALKPNGVRHSNGDYWAALFNVTPELGIEEECAWLGVRGIFYDHDSSTQFLKGVSVILKGQMWLSRHVMTRCILQNRGRDNPSKTDGPILTRREVQILAQVAVGGTNDEIADKLCISFHTVKTHLYNIYQKINVPNRLQAALWAAQNL